MERNVEHIIRNYSFYELSEAQKELISKWAINSDEFDALKHTLIATDEFNQSKEEKLNPTIKQRLDVRFTEKYSQERLVWYNKLWMFLWPTQEPFYKRPMIQFAAICLIVVFTIPFFPDFQEQQLALNETGQKTRASQKEKIESLKVEEVSSDNSKPPLKKGNKAAKTENKSDVKEKDERQPLNALKENRADRKLNQPEEENLLKNSKRIEMNIERSQENLDDQLSAPAGDSDQNELHIVNNSAIPNEKPMTSSLRFENDEVAKKVEVKETLDLLTALY